MNVIIKNLSDKSGICELIIDGDRIGVFNTPKLANEYLSKMPKVEVKPQPERVIVDGIVSKAGEEVQPKPRGRRKKA